MPDTKVENRKPGKVSEMMAKHQRGEINNMTLEEMRQPRPGERPVRQHTVSDQPKPKTSQAKPRKMSQTTSNENHVDDSPQMAKMVKPDPQKDTYILPVIQKSSRPARKAGERFGGLDAGRTIKEQELLFFQQMTEDAPVPLLDIVDASGRPIKTHNGVVPLEQRLLIRIASSVAVNERENSVLRMAVTLRELRDGMFPRGWHRKNQWPRLRCALINLNQYAFPYAGNLWFPMALRSMPEEPRLEDTILIDISYPEGAKTGPIIDLVHLDSLAMRSAADFRAYIGAHSLLWVPGRTRVPVPRSRGHYGWTKKTDAYPILTREHRRKIAYGLGDKKHRTRSEIDEPFTDIKGIKVVDFEARNPKTGEVGWRIVHADSPC